jgi:hypothetical protein
MGTSMRLIYIACFSIAVGLFAVSADAQDPVDSAVAHIGVGGGINFYNPTDNEGQTSHGAALVYRWHSFHSGWGPTIGLDWHSTNFDRTLGGVDAPLGSLRMRAVLAGVGHTHQFGHFSASGSLSAGYTFNHFTLAGDAIPTFARTGVSLVGAHVDNSWIAKPDLSVWYDVFRHVGVGVSAAYLVARPEQTITTTAGTEGHHLKADAFELTAGVTFGVWKRKQ